MCSAYGGFNFPGDDPFHLQRIPVDDDMIRLKNWVTQDPRKICTPRFEYRGAGDTRRSIGDEGSGAGDAQMAGKNNELPAGTGGT